MSAGGGVTWRMAWRNLWRHRSRSWILISVIAVTYGFALIGISIGDDSHNRMLEDAVRLAGGDVLVHGEGYRDSRTGDILIPDGDAVMERVTSVPGVVAAHPRVLVNGLVSTSAASRPVYLQGVVPGPDGAFQQVAGDVARGTFLEEDRRDPLVLGAELADELEAELGDRIVLTATGPDGEVTRALFHLTGVLETGTREMDEGFGYTTVAAARSALRMGGALTQIGLEVEDAADADGVANAVRAAVGSPGPPDAGDTGDTGDTGAAGRLGAVAAEDTPLEVLTWSEAVPEMVGFIELDDAFGYIYLVVIFVVVLFAITNTFLMAVMERVRELGLLSALGLKDRRIGSLLVAETVLLTGVAMALGFALGLGLHLVVQEVGISVALYGIDEMEIAGIDMADMVIRSTITPAKWVAASALVAVASVTSSLYPAWRATRLAPAEAMRFFE